MLKRKNRINMIIAKSKAKPLPLQTWATRWKKQLGARYQCLVPEIIISTLKHRKTLLIFLSSSMVWKTFNHKFVHNLVPANKSKFDSIENWNCAECGLKYRYQNHLKALINDTFQTHLDKPVTINLELSLEKNLSFCSKNSPARIALSSEKHNILIKVCGKNVIKT